MKTSMLRPRSSAPPPSSRFAPGPEPKKKMTGFQEGRGNLRLVADHPDGFYRTILRCGLDNKSR